MKYLATKSVTIADRARRSIALVLDAAFGRGSDPRDHRLLLRDFDELVEKLEQSFGGRSARVAEQLSSRLEELDKQITTARETHQKTHDDWLEHARKHPLDAGNAFAFARQLQASEYTFAVLQGRRMEIFHALELLTLP